MDMGRRADQCDRCAGAGKPLRQTIEQNLAFYDRVGDEFVVDQLSHRLWCGSLYSIQRLIVFAPLRFIWNATRGNRLTPWRSEYLKWRIETYSGKKADSLRVNDMIGFVWQSRWELLDFLAWTGRLEREVRRKT